VLGRKTQNDSYMGRSPFGVRF